MGTNYYVQTKEPCPHCSREYPALHIGKSSAGWCFALHVDPENGINDLDDWRAIWSQPDARIFDEYGKAITIADMELIITVRSHPRGLSRHDVIAGGNVVKNGAGTWDCLTGYFS